MKRISRRSFVSGAAGGFVVLQARPRSAAEKPVAKERRLLFNWDGSMIHCFGRAALKQSTQPLTREQFTSLVFTPIEKSPVNAVMFNFGSGNVAEYQSNVLEWPGQADDFRFPESKSWHGGIEVDPRDQYLNPKSLADAGHNPPALIVQECRKRGLDAFVSLRMNDCHDGQHAKGVLPNPELPTFKRQNPDWLVQDLDWWSALDYRLPRVRALKLSVIEEYFDRWDFDGIELDWLRHSLYFPRGTERENGKYLTEFMRTVRRSLNDRAAQRGRPIEIAVRIPERVGWCLEGGFEVPGWISENLVDILILGQGLTEIPKLEEFRNLMKSRRLPIYGSLYMYGNGYRISPDEVIRGSAANLWQDGIDGLYTFNWFIYGSFRRQLLQEIADPEILQRKNKHYTLVQRFEATPREPGADYIRYNTVTKDAPLPFNLQVTSEPVTLFIPIAENPPTKTTSRRTMELWIGMDHTKPGDVLTISAEGKVLEPAEIKVDESLQSLGYQLEIPPDNGMLGFPPTRTYDLRFNGLRVDIPTYLVKRGRNAFTFRLKARGAGAEKPLRVTRVELVSRLKDST